MDSHRLSERCSRGLGFGLDGPCLKRVCAKCYPMLKVVKRHRFLTSFDAFLGERN